MRIKISTILRVLVYIAILVNIHFAYFLNIPLVPPFVATNFIIVCSLLLLSTIKNNGIYAASCKKITPFIAVGTLCFAVETIYSMIRFSQSVGEVWSSSKYFMQLLMVYSIVYILSTEKKDIMCDMACITSFGLMLRLIYAVLYNTYNINIKLSTVNFCFP